MADIIVKPQRAHGTDPFATDGVRLEETGNIGEADRCVQRVIVGGPEYSRPSTTIAGACAIIVRDIPPDRRRQRLPRQR